MPRKKPTDQNPVGAPDKRYHQARQFDTYLKADDSQQFDIMREKWSALNWDMMHTAHETARAVFRGEKKATELSPLIIAAGIGFDKLYSKRPATVQPLSFPAPLLAMVRKGLELANGKRKPTTTGCGQPLKTKEKHDADQVSAPETPVNTNETADTDIPEQLT